MSAALPATERQSRFSLKPEDFQDPIAFIYGDHERIRRACDKLRDLAGDLDGPAAPCLAAELLSFLERDLPLHLADEEEDLFPLLRATARPTDVHRHDEVISSIEVLETEHRDDIEKGQTLRRALRALAEGEQPRDPRMFTHYARAFTHLLRDHCLMENNVVLPAALDRLSDVQLARMGRRMAARRGLRWPG